MDKLDGISRHGDSLQPEGRTRQSAEDAHVVCHRRRAKTRQDCGASEGGYELFEAVFAPAAFCYSEAERRHQEHFVGCCHFCLLCEQTPGSGEAAPTHMSDSDYEPEYEPERFTIDGRMTLEVLAVVPPPLEYMSLWHSKRQEISGRQVWTGSLLLAHVLANQDSTDMNNKR